jgi:hypothetical protein
MILRFNLIYAMIVPTQGSDCQVARLRNGTDLLRCPSRLIPEVTLSLPREVRSALEEFRPALPLSRVSGPRLLDARRGGR